MEIAGIAQARGVTADIGTVSGISAGGRVLTRGRRKGKARGELPEGSSSGAALILQVERAEKTCSRSRCRMEL